MTVSVDQNRSDQLARVLEVTVHNGSADDLTVTSARLVSPGLVSTPWTRAVEVPAGLSRDLATSLGARDCGAAAGATTVEVEFTTADGRTGEARIRPDDPFGTLERVAGDDCFAERLTASATLAFTDEVEVEQTADGLVGVLSLVVTPEPAGSGLELVSVRRSILIRPAAENADTWPLDDRIAPADPPHVERLEVAPSVCNPHNVGEDSRSTVFPVVIRLADGTSDAVSIPLPATAIEQLHDFIDRYCGWV